MEKAAGHSRAWYLNRSAWLGFIFAAISILLAVLMVFVYWDEVKELETFGYLGAFLVGLMVSTVIIIPFPEAVLIFALGGILNPLMVGPAVGLGETVGSLSLYLAGREGGALWHKVELRTGLYARMERWMKKRGGITLFIVSAILSPLFYPTGIAAGATKFPFWRFVLIVAIGKIIKGIVIAGAGSLGIQWFMK